MAKPTIAVKNQQTRLPLVTPRRTGLNGANMPKANVATAAKNPYNRRPQGT